MFGWSTGWVAFRLFHWLPTWLISSFDQFRFTGSDQADDLSNNPKAEAVVHEVVANQYWLIGWLADWWSHSLTDWVINLLDRSDQAAVQSNLKLQMADRLDSWLVKSLTDWSTSPDRSDQAAVQSNLKLQMADRLDSWLVKSLTDWLINFPWLIWPSSCSISPQTQNGGASSCGRSIPPPESWDGQRQAKGPGCPQKPASLPLSFPPPPGPRRQRPLLGTLSPSSQAQLPADQFQCKTCRSSIGIKTSKSS